MYLSTRRDKSSALAIAQLLGDQEGQVREAAANALGKAVREVGGNMLPLTLSTHSLSGDKSYSKAIFKSKSGVLERPWIQDPGSSLLEAGPGIQSPGSRI